MTKNSIVLIQYNESEGLPGTSKKAAEDTKVELEKEFEDVAFVVVPLSVYLSSVHLPFGRQMLNNNLGIL